MTLLPKNLVEMHAVGARTRERLASARQVPAFADCGLTLAGPRSLPASTRRIRS